MVEQRRPPKEKVITPPLNSPWESYLFKHFTPLATMTGANLGNTKLTKAKRSLEKIFGLPTGKMLSSEQLIEIHAGKTSLLIAYLTRNQSRIVRTLAPDVLSRELIRAKKLWPAWQEELLAYIHEDKRLS